MAVISNPVVLPSLGNLLSNNVLYSMLIYLLALGVVVLAIDYGHMLFLHWRMVRWSEE